MKSRKWRTYFGYKRPSLAYPAQQLTVSLRSIVVSDLSPGMMITPADAAYIEWLAKERRTTRLDAWEYASSEPRGRIVSQKTDFIDIKQPTLKPGKKWKANYIWYRPTPFRAKTLGERDGVEQIQRYRAFQADRNPDFRRAA